MHVCVDWEWADAPTPFARSSIPLTHARRHCATHARAWQEHGIGALHLMNREAVSGSERMCRTTLATGTSPSASFSYGAEAVARGEQCIGTRSWSYSHRCSLPGAVSWGQTRAQGVRAGRRHHSLGPQRPDTRLRRPPPKPPPRAPGRRRRCRRFRAATFSQSAGRSRRATQGRSAAKRSTSAATGRTTLS